MEFLKSVIPLIDNAQFSLGIRESRHLQQLFDLISKQKVQNDDEALAKIYGSDKSPIAYKKLKQRLRDRLTEHVVKNGVTSKNLDEYARLYRKCMNQVLAVKTLMLSYAKAAAVQIGENLIKTTIGYEYTDLTLLLARELYTYYSVINFHPAKFRKYKLILDKAEILYARELEASRYYGELRIKFTVSRGSIKDSSLKSAITYSNKLTPYLKDTNVSYQLLITIYEIIAMRFELAQDYSKLLEISDEATSAFRQRKVSRKFAFFIFDVNKIICNIQFGNHDEVEIIAQSHFKQMASSSLNWFVLKTYILVSRLHSKNYQTAYQIMFELRHDKGYLKLPNAVLQTLRVYEAHLEFLISIGKITSPQPSKFRLHKFLNEIPLFTKDKRGLNIAVLIVHVLFLLQQRKYTQIIDRVDALNQYCHRHLRRDDTFRSNCMIRMLLQIPRADFNRMRTLRYAQPYLNKLKSMPLLISQQSIEVEIIPYEQLWAMVGDLLD